MNRAAFASLVVFFLAMAFGVASAALNQRGWCFLDFDVAIIAGGVAVIIYEPKGKR